MLRRLLRAGTFVLLLALCATMLTPASAQTSSVIRVYLRRLQITDSARITVSGTYMLEDGSMLFGDGTQMTVVLRGDRLVLHVGQVAVQMGDSVKLLRCESEPSGGLTINGSNLYEGDLRLDIFSGVIRPILSIHVEDYLLGVVPYEMGDSFPLEALKAQAIAARTYALRKSGSDGDYDVEDTTNDQAFRGRSTSSPLSEQAVRETEGLVGSYKGRLAECFYSASNGGQTELGQHVWPTSEPDAYGYMDMRDDPYDYENDASVVKRYTLTKKAAKNGVGEALHIALVEALAPELKAMGKEASADCVRIDEVISVEAITPKFEGESRLMTEMRFAVRLSVRDCLYRDPGQSAATPTPAASVSPEPTPTPTPRPTATPAYSDYNALDDVFAVTLPIFPMVEQAMGLSISTAKNELITVTDIGSAFMIESRRYGHGVGMSQRGAEQMARKYGKTYEEILAFYYPGMTVERYALDRSPLPTADMAVMATPEPTPSPTPRPTLMPVSTENLPKGAYLAVVTNIDDDSSLNLRESPSLSAQVLRRLLKNQQLIVLSTDAGGWAHVRTDVVEGYVRSEYLQSVQQDAQ